MLMTVVSVSWTFLWFYDEMGPTLQCRVPYSTADDQHPNGIVDILTHIDATMYYKYVVTPDAFYNTKFKFYVNKPISKTTYRGRAMIRGFFVQKTEKIVAGCYVHVLKYQVAGGLVAQPHCNDGAAYCARVLTCISIHTHCRYLHIHTNARTPHLANFKRGKMYTSLSICRVMWRVNTKIHAQIGSINNSIAMIIHNIHWNAAKAHAMPWEVVGIMNIAGSPNYPRGKKNYHLGMKLMINSPSQSMWLVN